MASPETVTKMRPLKRISPAGTAVIRQVGRQGLIEMARRDFDCPRPVRVTFDAAYRTCDLEITRRQREVEVHVNFRLGTGLHSGGFDVEVQSIRAVCYEAVHHNASLAGPSVIRGSDRKAS